MNFHVSLSYDYNDPLSLISPLIQFQEMASLINWYSFCLLFHDIRVALSSTQFPVLTYIHDFT